MVEVGFRLPWAEARPPLLASPPPSIRPPAAPEAAEALEGEVASLLQKGAVELLHPPVSPGFYARLFCVPKTSGGWRPVLDLSALNKFLLDVHFRMETPASIRDSIQEGDWAASIDLSDAYYHLLVHRRDRKFLRFQWKGQTFQFRALPFGLSLAPWVFTRVVRELLLKLRADGMRIRAYLDDWLVLASSRALCESEVSKAMVLTRALGFRPNLGKSELSPSQQFTFLGMSFNTIDMTVAPSRERVNRLLRSLSHLSGLEQASARQLASLLGRMESLAPLLPLGRLRKRPFERAFRHRFDQKAQSWETTIPLGDWFLESVSHWKDESWLAQCVPIHPPPADLTLFTDASSSEGWGGHLDILPLSAEGLWSTEDLRRLPDINLLEMEGVRLCLLEFLPQLSGNSVMVHTDNMSVSRYICREGGRKRRLSLMVEEMLLWCRTQGITLSSRHLSGRLNILADMLSRPNAVLQTEWTISHHALQRVWAHFFRPQLDLFATRFNHRLPVYVSPVPDGIALAADALSMDWSSIQAYAYPPLAILPRVIQKARREKPCLILIAPFWPAQPWFPELLQIARGEPLALNLRFGELLQPRTGVPHGNVQVLNLHAFLVCDSHLNH